MTEQEALTICKELWDWIGRQRELPHPDSPGSAQGHKARAPIWKKYGKMMHACPCCEYVYGLRINYEKRNCTSCPLLSLWDSDETDAPCTNPISPYEVYKQSDEKESRRAALKIANYCRKRLKEIKQHE